MILYFSATGNCKYVAERIAAKTGDKTQSVTDCIKTGEFSFDDGCIGIISPTYFWGIPSVMRDFLMKAELRADHLYFIATYGTTPGASRHFAQKYIGRKFDASFSIRMADTWTVWFDLSTPEAVAKFTKNTERDIDTVISRIESREKGNFTEKEAPAFIAGMAYSTYESGRSTKNLSADENCIGCGLCAQKCPVGAIEIKEKRPVWVKDKCAMCLGCLHRCPKFSIQYGNGKGTRKHGQYLNPNVKI